MLPVQLEYPKFVPDQLLTSEDLNQLFGYLDEQDRMTRANLVGIGIVCGLNVKVNNTQTAITISKGCGVTSEGYLVCTNTETYAQYKKYKVDTPRVYNPFFKMSGSNKVPIDVWELVQAATDAETLPLNSAFIQDKVVMIFVELKEEINKNCNPNSCDDKGGNVTVSFLPMLVSKTDAQALMGTTAGAFGINTYTSLPELRMKKWDVPNSKPVYSEDIFKAYLSVLNNSFIKDLESKLKNTYTIFGSLAAGDYASNPFNGFAQKFAFLTDGSISLNQLVHIQYYYDFFSDMILAYQEFRKTGTHLLSACCPDSNLFPRHLLLGEAVPVVNSGKLPFRHYFIYSPLYDYKDVVAELKSLFARMVIMVENFFIAAPQGMNTKTDAFLRITPSSLSDAALSDKAIPYYYVVNSGSKPLYLSWSFRRTLLNDANRLLSYHASLYNNTDEFVREPLKYDLEPYNFLRVEGIIGKSYTHVLRQVKSKIAEYRLPVDVIALNTDSDLSLTALSTASFARVAASRDDTDALCYFQDIESLYDSIKNEILCGLCKELKYYYDSKNDVLNSVLAKFAIAGTASTVDLFDVCSPGYIVRDRTLGVLVEFLHRKGFTDVTITTEKLFAALGMKVVDANDDDMPDNLKGQAALIYLALLNLCKVSLGIIRIAGLFADDLAEFDEEEYCTASVNVADYAKSVIAFFEMISSGVKEPITTVKTSAVAPVGSVVEKVSSGTTAAMSIDEVSATAQPMRATLAYNPTFFAALAPAATSVTSLQAGFLTVKDLMDHLEKLSYTCRCAALSSLKEDYTKRYQMITRLRQFGYFTNMHPGIQHKAGVPLGGTFIVVYHSRKRRQTLTQVTNTIEELAFDRAGRTETLRLLKEETGTAIKADTEASEKIQLAENSLTQNRFSKISIGTTKDEFIRIKTGIAGIIINEEKEPVASAKITIVETGENTLSAKNGSFKLVSSILPFTVLVEADGYEDFEVKKFDDDLKMKVILKEAKGSILDGLAAGTVIADFYLPYRCCSDCPPIQYIITEKEEPPVPNQGPVANAGPDQLIVLPQSNVTLNGTASTDPDGSITFFQWAKLSGPGAPEIVTPTSAQTNVVDLEEGAYIFELSVTDDKGSIARDTVAITVRPLPPAENKLPTANAGTDISVVLSPNTFVNLDGSLSKDEDGTIVSFRWVQLSGPAVTIVSPGLVQTPVTGLQAGAYEFELTVTDNSGGTGSDKVSVTVTPPENKPPVADAGKDQSVTISPNGSVALDGSNSIDPEGGTLQFKWKVAGGPNTPAFNNDALPNPQVSGLLSGEYKFLLTVADNKGASADDTVIIMVQVSDVPKAVCGPLSGVVVNFNEVNANATDEFKRLFQHYDELLEYFKNLQGISAQATDVHIKFFETPFNVQSTEALIIKWLSRLQVIILESDKLRLIALQLYEVLVKLTMYIACIQKNDFDSADVPTVKIFSVIQNHMIVWIDRIKNNQFTVAETAVVKNIDSGFENERKIIIDKGEANTKPGYLKFLDTIAALI